MSLRFWNTILAALCEANLPDLKVNHFGLSENGPVVEFVKKFSMIKSVVWKHQGDDKEQGDFKFCIYIIYICYSFENRVEYADSTGDDCCFR